MAHMNRLSCKWTMECAQPVVFWCSDAKSIEFWCFDTSKWSIHLKTHFTCSMQARCTAYCQWITVYYVVFESQ